MKRFKEMATIFLFALLAAGFTSSAMAASGSDSPWDFDFRVHGFLQTTTPDSLQLPPPLVVLLALINP